MSKAEALAKELYPDWKMTGVPTVDGLENSEIRIQRVAYTKGYHQAEKDLLDNIWHSPDEEPEIDRKIIWESENFLGKHLDKEWKPMIDCFGRKERWCYLADILPSENWTGERPYSKVDYSRGYEKGYEQAEKDLELTWEDIADILDVTDVIANDDSMEVRLKNMSEEEYYQEVLERFKEMKGK